MIIDLRTSALSGDLEGRLAPTLSEDFADAMSFVEAAVVVGPMTRGGSHPPTNGDQTGGRVTRLLPFAALNASAASIASELEDAIDGGAVGISISPADDGYRATDSRCMSILEACAARNLPVLVANPRLRSPASALEFANPGTLDECARTIKGLTLILGDLAHGWMSESLLMAAKHERVFIEISGVIGRPWALYTTLLSAQEQAVAGKLLFASGYPNATPQQAIERIYSINAQRTNTPFPLIPRETLRQIVERDSLTALGIPHAGLLRPVVRLNASRNGRPGAAASAN